MSGEDPWAGAREETRRQVASIFSPEPQVCPRCGAREVTSARTCPRCGESYVVLDRRRVPPWLTAIAALLVLAGLAGALALGSSLDGNGEDADAERAEMRRAERLRRGAVEQRPRIGEGERPAGALAPAAERRARRGLISDVESAIARDARARVRRGRLDGPILGVRCEPYPRSVSGVGAETRVGQRVGRYQCLAATAAIPAGRSNPAGEIGHPYLVRVDFERFRYAFCKVSPPPGEKAVPLPGARVPAACVGR